MRQEIGIRELKNQLSSIVRLVREESAEYVITHHGQPVAVLRPFDEEDTEKLKKQKAMESLEELLEIGRLLYESNPEARSAVEILEEMREEENQWPLLTPAS
jgi:prevent-host-death family protein